ncbi:MAG: hypothetical protein LBG42_03865 [Treponema sp.]|nr:hypothetical protein [Treponema sp.]
MRKVSLLFLAVCFTGAFFFPGCDAEGGINPLGETIILPDNLVGKWVSTYGEEFEIKRPTFGVGEFIASYSGTVGYSGPILNVRSDGFGGGYITILYTVSNWTSGAVGRYYVIHWQRLTGTSVEFAGSKDGAGRPTQLEAEWEYQVINGYFDMHSSCTKTP